MIWIYLLLCLVLGFIGGMAFTMRAIRDTIRHADISSADKDMIRNTLGIKS